MSLYDLAMCDIHLRAPSKQERKKTGKKTYNPSDDELARMMGEELAAGDEELYNQGLAKRSAPDRGSPSSHNSQYFGEANATVRI
ncbi:hypothetical protein N7532_006039 [Penicillium argentinense]|uniref:Uncharacterized protein n=1 Tax=Penicillium argentinense TaxID=1131581 RepID=A0A9W9FF20_9EURO|nr:uncharacterized protein N7532_006039 [Penicillium argentinense]KAJ5099038.1 hypothetical protein N7532_006039 [Penicillium argentinense]